MNKIIFLGYGEYGVSTLSGLIQSDYQVILILTHPSKRGAINPVLDLAQKHEIEHYFSSQLVEKEIVETIVKMEPDFIVSTNWRYRIPSKILRIPKIAALNVHDSLLPNYAGLSAEYWVIRNNEKQTGVTVHIMSDIMDAGPIVLQESVLINNDDTSFDVARKQLRVYPKIIIEALTEFSNPGFTPKLKELKEYKRYHRITKRDRRIQWEKSPQEIYNMFRAHRDPTPNCFFLWKNKKFWIKSLAYSDCSYCGEPGRVVTHLDEGVGVVTGSGVLDSHYRSGIILKQVSNEMNCFLDPKNIFPIDAQLD
ncbi:MAG: methionyl-tRNA formyltransferase [Cyanobacteria bacterium SBLK]|nr:methionyl-tRNA formyltransferase [Cyanobacteria bacterium SBLK]